MSQQYLIKKHLIIKKHDMLWGVPWFEMPWLAIPVSCLLENGFVMEEVLANLEASEPNRSKIPGFSEEENRFILEDNPETKDTKIRWKRIESTDLNRFLSTLQEVPFMFEIEI